MRVYPNGKKVPIFSKRTNILSINTYFKCRTIFIRFEKKWSKFISIRSRMLVWMFCTVSNACQLNLDNTWARVFSHSPRHINALVHLSRFFIWSIVCIQRSRKASAVTQNLLKFMLILHAKLSQFSVYFVEINSTVKTISFMSKASTSTKVESKRIPHLMCTQSIETRCQVILLSSQQLTLDHMLAFIWRWSWHWRWLLAFFPIPFVRWFRFRFRFWCSLRWSDAVNRSNTKTKCAP